MNKVKEKLLNDTYIKYIQTSLADLPLEDIHKFIDENFTGYGTALNEKLLSISDYRELVVRQRDQGKDINFDFTSTPITRKVLADGNSALYVDEIIIKMHVNSESNEMLLRLSTVLEYRDEKWIVIHFHGSKPEYDGGENDPWHVDEWQQKNAELEKLVEEKTADLLLKNRELEIEAALEKARTIAMGMREPADMLDVCKTISLQLKSIGVKEIRNVQTAIFNEQCGTYMNYEYYAKHNKSFITETTYTNNKIHKAFAAEMLKGKGEFYITHIKGKKVKDWVAYQKTTNVFIDRYLNTASSLNYYWYSLGPVALGISTYHPLTAFEKNLFKRFLTVFELAYRRYLDIKKAEAQTRDAQIELALERVRARTMAMHQSSELSEAGNMVFRQIKHLGIHAETSWFWFIDLETDSIEIWTTHKNKLAESLKVNAADYFTFQREIEAWKNQESFFKLTIPKQDAIKSIQDIFGIKLSNKKGASHFHLLQTRHKYGFLGLGTWYEATEQEKKICARFAAVFEQTYTRFLDLQKAESQAREAQIEASLERVRSKTMAMHNSHDVGVTVVTLFDEVLKLGLDKSIRCGIGILEGTERMETWSATSYPNGDVDLKMGMLDMTIHPLLVKIKNSWKSGNTRYTDQMTGKSVIRYYTGLNNEPDYPFHIALDTLPETEYHNSFSFPEGILFAFSPNPMSEETAMVLNRFAHVFGQTYRRYIDLQKAEAQAREAQIEASLERVRAKAMAMHKSDDLTSTVATVFSELDRLGFKTIRCGVGIFNDQSRKVNVWTASSNGKSDLAYLSGDEILEGHPLLEGIYESWQNQIDYSYVLKGKDLKDYYKAAADSNLPVSGPEVKTEIATQYYQCAFFPAGGLFAFGEREFTSEAKHLMKRFADVFHLTFTRHLDLKQAEAQNKIIQAENDRKTKELEEARALQLAMLPKELPKLPDLAIAVYMKTATEVGGDYYDFCFNENGSFNICLGDATGHGMKAGIMVSSMKSIFTTNAPKMDIEKFFATANSGIKSMNLKRMMMGFILLNINKNVFKLINAGMPPIFIFRKKSNTVDEIREHGLPVGAMGLSRYTVTDLFLKTGDVMLLMTDGMPELQNANNKMYGYERILDGFKKVGNNKPEEIISYLKNEGSTWVNDKDPEDDVTFVVIKVK